MKDKKLLIAHYKTQQETEQAIKKLRQNGYDITKLCVIGTDCYTEQNVLGYHNLYDKMEKWSILGLFAIAFAGLLFGSFFYFNIGMSIPYFRISIIYVCGAILLAAAIPLVSLALSREPTIKYRTQIKALKFMLFTNESAAQIEKMRSILKIHVPKENSTAEKENQLLLENDRFHSN
jgi:hypothetical protein